MNVWADKEKWVEFDPPNDIVLASTGVAQPVLSYRIDPSNDARNLAFTVSIRQLNGTDVQISNWVLSGTTSRTVFEIVSGANLHKGKQRIIFRVLSGIGSLYVRDVIFWFTRSI